LLEIADDSSNDWMDVETKAGRIIRVFDHEHARRSEIRIRVRQWLMSKFAPKRFGERPHLDASGETMEAVAAKSPDERLEEALALIARAKRRVAEAYASGEISEADFEDVSGDSEKA
jgi:terminase small subunit-like protein